MLLIPFSLKMMKTNFEDNCNTLCLLIHVRVYKNCVIPGSVSSVNGDLSEKSPAQSDLGISSHTRTCINKHNVLQLSSKFVFIIFNENGINSI